MATNGTRARPSLLRRIVAGGAWATIGLVAATAAVAYWLLATSSGATFVLERAVAVTGGSVSGVEGRLAGPISVDALEIATGKVRVRARRLALDWSPLALLGSELRIERLHAASLEIVTAPSTEPAREPSTLVPALRIRVEGAGADRVSVAALGSEKDAVELRDVSLRLAGDPAAWILGGAEATTPIGRAKLAGTFASRAPFALDAKGSLEGTRGEAAYLATLAATGTLAAIDATLSGAEGALTGSARARVEPFAAVPLRALEAKLQGVDLAAFGPVSHTKLTIDARLAPGEGAVLAGPVVLVNSLAGPLDKERIPVESARAVVAIGKDRVRASALSIAFAGGGSARGEAAWAGGKLDAKFAVRDADLRSWQSTLRATRLAGELVAEATAQAQSFTVALVEPRFAIRGDARIAQGRLTVGKARIERGAAFAEAGGTLELGGRREFRVEGRVERLDPAAFAKVPAGELNATFSATGRLDRAAMAGAVSLEIERSRYAGLATAGRAAFAWQPGRIADARADLAVGETRLVAQGALGRPGDAMEVKLASPDLAPVGRAFGVALGGRLEFEAKLAGSLEAPSGRVAIDAKDLVLPGAWTVASARGSVALGQGDSGEATGEVAITGIGKRGRAAPLATRASVTLKGTRSSHDIGLEADFPDESAVRALLYGGMASGGRAPEWRGRIESFGLSGLTALALAAPARLVASAEGVELGEALFAGEPGEIRLAETQWTPAGLRTRGSSSAVVVRTIRRILDVQGEVASTLVLAGDWDLRVGETVDGFASLRRLRGDVRLGEPRQAMGLEELALRADAAGGRVKATLEVRGSRIGRWRAEGDATLRAGESGWEISPVAPLSGRFDVDVPDLAWMAAWVGPEARTAGRLKGEGVLEGTARDPTWNGRVELSGLSLREPTLGAEVEEGTVAISLKDREARIERFELAMPWRPGSSAARAIAAAKRPAKGTLTAEGSMDIATRKGSLRVKASAFPLTRLESRFLAISGEGRAELDGPNTVMTGNFTADAGWFGIPASAPPSLSDDVVVIRGPETAPATRGAGRIRLDLRVDLGEHLYFVGRGLDTRLAGALRLEGDPGANLRTTGTIRAVGGTYESYGRTLALERGALNFQGPVDSPGLNILALRKGLPVEAGVEVLGTVTRPKVRLYSTPDVPDPEKLAWLVLGRGQGDVSAADAATLLSAATAILGADAPGRGKILGGLGIDEVSIGSDSTSLLGTMPQSTVAGRTRSTTTADVVTVGARLTDDIRVSYIQGLADAEGSLRIAWQYSRTLEFILRAGYLQGIDAVYRFSFR
jgi:translocation and assembly module TamB